MNAPLYNALIEYSRTKYPFHMPGHKLGTFGNLKSLELMSLDVTEANGLDNLYEAEGIIEEAMIELSKFYGAKDTIMLTNGSTAGILASILALCKPGEKLLVARNCHHSVWHALILSGAVPIYITPEYDEETGLLTSITAETIEKSLRSHPDVKGAIIVSPTYEGVVSDIDEIAKVLHKEEKCLIVDEAHGAHFVVDDYFPKSSLMLGADIVIHSMHKTLPTLTQSALLHLGSSRIDKNKIIKSLRMVQTSSPSYVMMGVMDYIRAYIDTNRADIVESYIAPLELCRKKLAKMRKLALLDYQTFYDRGKIIIFTTKTNIDGYKLAELLEEEYQIVCEAALPDSIILMTTLADTKQTLELLTRALLKIDETLSFREEVPNKGIDSEDSNRTSNKVSMDLTKLYSSHTLSPREVHYSMEMKKEVGACEGFISKENIMLYPPGIPIVCIGEVMTKEHIDLIRKWQHKLKGIVRQRDEIICKVTKLDLQ